MQYARIVTDFWGSKTCGEISEGGDSITQLVALYLLCNSHANLTGVYYLPIGYICEDIGTIDFNEAKGAIDKLVRVGYCCYDYNKKIVWVKKMLYYQVGEKTKLGDNQSKCIKKHIDRFLSHDLEFMGEFLNQYSTSHNIV